MQLTTDLLQRRLDEIAASGLLTREEMRDVLALLAPTFPAAAALARAESVHLHVRVDDVEAVRASLAVLGAAENEKPGYVKLRAAGGVHLIVSSIEVAEEDRVATLPRRARPHLDHVGVDLRDASPPSREAFDAIATRAEHAKWRAVHQGGAGASVACCHASVSEKRWLFPPTDSGLRTPIEVAFGPLERGEGAGTDLRPIDPRARGGTRRRRRLLRAPAGGGGLARAQANLTLVRARSRVRIPRSAGPRSAGPRSAGARSVWL
jgi:hypothetical protein